MWNRDKSDRNLFDTLLSERPAERPAPPAPSPAAVAEHRPPPAAPKAEPEPPVVRAPAAPPPPSASATKGSVLGATLRFRGDLVADEDLVVQGRVEGSILHSRSLTIGADGTMQGDIRARRIVVEGTVAGDLYALECVTVRATATVDGSIYAPRVALEEGARFNGRIDMEKAPAVPKAVADEPQPVVATAAEPNLDEVEIDEFLSAADGR